ncbi:MAG TPA: type 4a pilus biogenesis protein PilO [bacterium]|nr:type 4a pilus biogenesis protein PilO [bacterium]
MRPLVPREKLLLLIVALLVVGVGFYYLIYSPKMKEINVVSLQLKTKQAELTRLQAEAAKKDQLERRLQDLQHQVAETEAKLPSSKEIPTLLVQLEGLAAQVGANLTLIRPGPTQGQAQGQSGQPPRPGVTASPAPGLGLQQFNLELNAEGTFDKVQSFVRGIENFPRYIAMSDLKITPLPPKQGESAERPRLAIGLSAVTYFVPESGGGR